MRNKVTQGNFLIVLSAGIIYCVAIGGLFLMSSWAFHRIDRLKNFGVATQAHLLSYSFTPSGKSLGSIIGNIEFDDQGGRLIRERVPISYSEMDTDFIAAVKNREVPIIYDRDHPRVLAINFNNDFSRRTALDVRRKILFWGITVLSGAMILVVLLVTFS